jgi:hypothetical protein
MMAPLSGGTVTPKKKLTREERAREKARKKEVCAFLFLFLIAL